MSKDTKVIHRVDDWDCFLIPGVLRETLEIKEGDQIVYYIDKDKKKVEIKKYIPDPPKTEKSVDQKAIEWLAAHKNMGTDEAQFSISGNTTICICCSNLIAGRLSVGKATCSPKDTFSPSIGMIISYCRACGKEIPDFIKL